MKVHDICDPQGRVSAFEISNTWISRNGVIRFLASLPDVRVIPRNKREVKENPDEFCAFMVRERRFVVWEPWGDSSRYWIGPDPPGWCEEVVLIREAFAARKTWNWPWKR
jgi:hypothetical protein